MLIYAKKVDVTGEDGVVTGSEIKLYGTTANVPGDDDKELVYKVDGAEATLTIGDSYTTISEDGTAYVYRASDSKSVAVYISYTDEEGAEKELPIIGVPANEETEEDDTDSEESIEGETGEESTDTSGSTETEETTDSSNTDTTGSEEGSTATEEEETAE